jgi:hypothetical protein
MSLRSRIGMALLPPIPARPRTAFVLSGGASLNALQVGMLRALYDRGIVPDSFVGASAGALNAAFVACRPQTVDGIDELAAVWASLRREDGSYRTSTTPVFTKPRPVLRKSTNGRRRRARDGNMADPRMTRRRYARLTAVLVALGLLSCSTLEYRGALIDAKDSISEHRYGQALLDLDRARHAKELTTNEALEVSSLEAMCAGKPDQPRSQ